LADKSIFEKIALDLIEKNRIKKEETIVLGLSGGPDSIFCLYVLLKLRELVGIRLLCAHVNYNLRGESSNKDMEFCREVCSGNNVELKIKDVNITVNKGIQEKARKVRFSFFKKILKDNEGSRLALAHNKDDNVETILFNIIRGTGINGITGMDESSILRPIIDQEKDLILRTLDGNNIAYRIDETNRKTVYTRNIIRHNIIPELEKINPSFFDAIGKLSLSAKEHRSIAREKYEYMYYEYRIRNEKDELFIFDLDLFSESKESIAIFFELFFRDRLNIKEGIYRNALTELMVLKVKTSCKVKELKGYMFFTDYDRLFIVKKICFDRFFPDFVEKTIERPVDNDQVTFIPVGGLKPLDEAEIYIDVKLSDIKLPMLLRHRKNGDRISGKKLLKKIFIDKKVNRLFRDRIPVLTDARGRILWIPGVYKRKFKQSDMRLVYIGRKFWIKK